METLFVVEVRDEDGRLRGYVPGPAEGPGRHEPAPVADKARKFTTISDAECHAADRAARWDGWSLRAVPMPDPGRRGGISVRVVGAGEARHLSIGGVPLDAPLASPEVERVVAGMFDGVEV